MATTLEGDQFTVQKDADQVVYCPVCKKTRWSGLKQAWPYDIVRWAVQLHAKERGHAAEIYNIKNVEGVLLRALLDTSQTPYIYTWDDPHHHR